METNFNRRTFLKSAAVASASVTLLKPETVFGSRANSAIRMGLIGCGGRGTHVASSFMQHTDTRIVALADIFEDKLLKGKEHFNKINEEKGYPRIKNSHLFLGSNAYRKLVERKDIDAVYIATPTIFHPVHLEAAVAAGKHTYCEKPVAVDVEGVKKVKRIGKRAQGNVSIAIGLQIRKASPFVEMVNRIHRGDIGDIVTAQIYYFAGFLNQEWRKDIPYDEARLRAWFWDKSLSGSNMLDQGIHIVDICNWVLKSHPLRATGMCGRKGRNDQGDAWSHFQVLYEYPDDIHVNYHSTQFDPSIRDVCERFFGTKGISVSHYTGGVFITGENEWDSGVARGTAEAISKKDWATGTFKSSLEDADPNKQKAFIESIKTGRLINEAASGAQSTLTAILGRTAAYTGEPVTWEQVAYSNDRIDPMMDITQFDKK